MSIVVTGTPRTDLKLVDQLGAFGVATVHEAYGRKGLLKAGLRPIYTGAKAAGTAITVSVAPCDNWMLHAAVEQCREGDLVLVQPTSPSDSGYFGELLATSMRAHGVRGLVIDAGCRDIAPLTEMKFPVWSSAVFAQGTVKETLGSVNVGMVVSGQFVHPGDVVVADDDGVVVVRRQDAAAVIAACEAREKREAENRKRLASGELGLDIYKMREPLKAKGLVYMTHEEYRAKRA